MRVQPSLAAPSRKDAPHQVLQPVVPGVCGLPYIAVASRSMADSPLGALVVNKVADAFATDIGFAMLTYKWQTYAGTVRAWDLPGTWARWRCDSRASWVLCVGTRQNEVGGG